MLLRVYAQGDVVLVANSGEETGYLANKHACAPRLAKAVAVLAGVVFALAVLILVAHWISGSKRAGAGTVQHPIADC
jgi:hypothetical protein